MTPKLLSSAGRAELAELYRQSLVEDVVPFWLQYGLDRDSGGMFTCLDDDGTVIDTDKSVWFQGRAAWTFATLADQAQTIGLTPGPHLDGCGEAAESCLRFLRDHCIGPGGKLWFSVTRTGQPLRMRRYAFSESFAAIGSAAYAKLTGDAMVAAEAVRYFDAFIRLTTTPGALPAKYEPTRPMKGLGPVMIRIATAQELRRCLGDVEILGETCSSWIDRGIAEIERDFVKPEYEAVLECVGTNGEVIDHSDGRVINPGHVIEGGWFILHEGRQRGDASLTRLGLQMIDWAWQRGWDERHGGLLSLVDLDGRPVGEYWHDMKFWWPHCEAIIATVLAWRVTGEQRYAELHQAVHDWSFSHFPDPVQGEWYGYLHRDGSLASTAKGTMWKGPFHLPRMLWYCHQRLTEPES